MDIIWMQVQLGRVQAALDRPEKGVPLAREGFRRAEETLGRNSDVAHTFRLSEGLMLEMMGDFDASEPIIRESVSYLASTNAETHAAYAVIIGFLLYGQGKYGQAFIILENAAKHLGDSKDPVNANLLGLLAGSLAQQERFEEAEVWARSAVSMAEKSAPRAVVGRASQSVSQHNILAAVLAKRGERGEAIELLRSARAVMQKTRLKNRSDKSMLASIDMQLAGILNQEPGRTDALALAEEASSINGEVYGLDSGRIRWSERLRADALLRQGQIAAALAIYESICPKFRGEHVMLVYSVELSTDCERGYVRALRAQVKQAAPASALPAAAFEAAQRAQMSASGVALSQASARAAAAESGAAPLIAAYESAMARREALDGALGRLGGQVDGENALQFRELTSRRAAADAEAKLVSTKISEVYPRYWDLLAPNPVSLSDLQATSGAAARLLQSDEALVLWLTEPGVDHGVVIAVSKRGAAWADIGMTGDEIVREVKRLRDQIDPCSYSASKGDCREASPRTFDRTAAYRLHQALLGDPAIAAIISPEQVKTLLIVPTGALTTLPPAVLVSSAPTGGAAADASPEALRATDWLIKRKALAILPTVSALETLRGLLPQAAPRDPKAPARLFMMADPDFSGVGGDIPANCRLGATLSRDAARLYVDSRTRRALLSKLCPLPGTRAEAEALKAIFRATGEDVLLGREAREARLYDAAGRVRLERADILAFATHGVVAGSMGLEEPALVLAAPLPTERDDGLLSASQAARLRLTAEWVILSACNTASPDAPTAQGLSGLSRAFFYAGARSLLVSHWRVDDDAAAAIVSATLRERQVNAKTSKAEALRKAMLELMRGGPETPDAFAFPAAWAPFTLVGEPS